MNWWAWVALGILVLNIAYRLWIRRGVANVSVHEIQQRLSIKDKMLLVDVREPREYNAGHIQGAVNIPLGTLEKGCSGFKRHDEILVICQSGNRSLTAYRKLKAMGFEAVRNVDGGMSRWAWETVRKGG